MSIIPFKPKAAAIPKAFQYSMEPETNKSVARATPIATVSKDVAAGPKRTKLTAVVTIDYATIKVASKSKGKAVGKKIPVAKLRLKGKGIDLNFEHHSEIVIGMAAAIAGVRTVLALAPGLAIEGFKLSSAKSYYGEIQRISDVEIQFSLKRFLNGLHLSHNSRRQTKDFVDWWSEKHWPDAQALVPPELRVMRRLERGVYDERGSAMTPKMIADRARPSLMGMFKAQMKELAEVETLNGEGSGGILAKNRMPVEPELGYCGIPWSLVVKVEGEPHMPVAINGAAYAAVQRLLYPLGFMRMPQTWAELKESCEFAHELLVATKPTLGVGSKDQAIWEQIAMKVHRESQPETADLFDALVLKDPARMKELHDATDYLTVLGKCYRADNMDAAPHSEGT